MKKLLLGTALFIAGMASANAAVVANLGVNPTSRTGDFASGTVGVNATGAGAFTDQVVFSLQGGPQFLTISSATNVYPATTDFITNFTAQGFLIVGGIGGGDDIAVTPLLVATACPTTPNCQGFSGSSLLNAGNYYLQLSGIGGGSSGYGGNLAVRAIPIPPAVALFGAGLAGLGWLTRRRKVV